MDTAGDALPPYRDDQGRPKLYQTIVAYLDEMGTSRRAQELTNPTDRDYDDGAALADILNGFEVARKELSDAYKRKDAVKLVSDSVFISGPFPIMQADGLIRVVADYVAALAPRGRFYRGGLHMGLVFQSPTMLYGPGVVDAVHLESDRAVFPRIVVSSVLREWLLALVKQMKPDGTSLVSRLLLRDSDDEWFVHYLSALVPTSAQLNSDWWASADAIEPIRRLEAHRGAIIALSRKAASADGVDLEKKAIWLSQYHNHFVTSSYAPMELSIPNVRDPGFSAPVFDLE